MRHELHKNPRVKRKPKYPLMMMSRLQATAVVAATASIGLVMLVVKVL